jgi:pyruvate dehydrogenase E2 component (dihydrolipoamide acetyltransferase)
MPVEVVLPKVDMDMETGIIAAWRVAEGDTVRKGDILFEMETDKAMMEVESPGSGRIRGLAAITGEAVPVGTPVAWIEAESDPAEIAPSQRATASTSPSPSPAKVSAPPAAVRAVVPGNEGERTRVRATPFARRTARAYGVTLDEIAGTGPRGRIVASDVETHTATQARGSTRVDPKAGSLVPFNPVRRIVAQRLAESARTVPHFYLSAHIEMTALREALRRHASEVEATTGLKPTLTVLLVIIVGRVLGAHPGVNASIEGEATRLHADVHVGVAMDRDGDLVVPVLRNASTRSLAEVTAEFARLRDAVRSRTITPTDMRGGTFTVSNLGMYGVDAFTAIINPPECAILAVGRTVATPVGRDGQIVLRPMATFTLSSDHRIVDGIAAARFMADLRQGIEDPTAYLQKEPI